MSYTSFHAYAHWFLIYIECIPFICFFFFNRPATITIARSAFNRFILLLNTRILMETDYFTDFIPYFTYVLLTIDFSHSAYWICFSIYHFLHLYSSFCFLYRFYLSLVDVNLFSIHTLRILSHNVLVLLLLWLIFVYHFGKLIDQFNVSKLSINISLYLHE